MALPDVKLRVAPEELVALANHLREIHYEESRVAEFLQIFDISQLDASEMPRYVWLCEQDGGSWAKTLAFFLLRQALPRREISKLLPKGILGALQMCGLIHRASGKLSCNVSIFPCLGQYFITDHWANLEVQTPGHIYELGLDSYAIARLTPRVDGQNSLDLCTGSGIHAIQSALSGNQSTAVDINPRALEYTKLNAAMNGTEVTAKLGDLYTPVEGEMFDLITVNPPFVPTPDREILVHRSPGETGEEVSERLLAGLSKHLQVGGLFSMILNYPVITGDDYTDRLERWLGETEGWLVLCMDLVKMELGAYIKGHMGPVQDYFAEFYRYLESYQKMKIESIYLANVFVIRTGRSHPNYKFTFKSTPSRESQRENVAHWLKCQHTFSDPSFRAADDWKPKQHRYLRTIWRDQDNNDGMVQPGPHNCIPGVELNGIETERVIQLRGESSCAELRERWSLSEAEFQAVIRDFGLRYIIDSP